MRCTTVVFVVYVYRVHLASSGHQIEIAVVKSAYNTMVFSM